MVKETIDFSKYQDIHKRFKCPRCKRRGLTLEEYSSNFTCVCGHTRPLDFWHKVFRSAPDTMTFQEASKIIGTNPTGSTLRRARLEGRLKTAGRMGRVNGEVGKKDYLIDRDELIRFYLTHLNRRPKKKVVLEN